VSDVRENDRDRVTTVSFASTRNPAELTRPSLGERGISADRDTHNAWPPTALAGSADRHIRVARLRGQEGLTNLKSAGTQSAG
jgi:hypothetical protein